jgi:hypothetical protein
LQDYILPPEIQWAIKERDRAAATLNPDLYSVLEEVQGKFRLLDTTIKERISPFMKPSQNSLFKADTDLSPWLRAEFWDWFIYSVLEEVQGKFRLLDTTIKERISPFINAVEHLAAPLATIPISPR